MQCNLEKLGLLNFNQEIPNIVLLYNFHFYLDVTEDDVNVDRIQEDVTKVQKVVDTTRTTTKVKLNVDGVQEDVCMDLPGGITAVRMFGFTCGQKCRKIARF